MNSIISMPTKQNTVLEKIQIQDIKPRFAKVSTLTKMYDVSKSSIYRWLNEAEQSGEWPKLFVEVSSTLSLVNLEEFERLLYSKHKKQL